LSYDHGGLIAVPSLKSAPAHLRLAATANFLKAKGKSKKGKSETETTVN